MTTELAAKSIEAKILLIRGREVMLDRDLAECVMNRSIFPINML